MSRGTHPNISGNYRPITLSTTHAKLIELLMLPKDDSCPSQFGFRDNRGTTLAAALFNDVTSYFRHRGSPVYTCSLDAEKCFDSIWHSARQGSVLSPRVFCIFLNSLLVDRECSNAGVRIGPDSYQSFAYADNINLLSATVGGLHSLIDICLAYSKKWRFNFGIAKSKCMISGADLFCRQPSWYLGYQRMENSTELDVLGIIFTNNGKSEKHVN